VDGGEYYIKKYGLNREEVIKWGETHYPEFAKNLALIAQLYLIKVKGVQPKPPIRADKITKIAALKEGDRAVIKVVATMLIGEREYLGCPTCKKRVTPNNNCPNCGIVNPKEYKWVTYNAGDDTGEVILNFPPGVSEELPDLTGKVLLVIGRYRGGEFIVENYDICDDSEKTTQPALAKEENVEEKSEETKEVEDTSEEKQEVSYQQPESHTSDESSGKVSPAEMQQDIEKGKILVKYFKGQTITKEEYNAWKDRMKIKTPDDILFEELGLELTSDGEIFIRGVDE